MFHRIPVPGELVFHHPVPGILTASHGHRTVAVLQHVLGGWSIDFSDGLHLMAPTLGEARASVRAHDAHDGD
jgi:hypothetical protein